MTNLEFTNEFDILYNNIMSNAAPGLDVYEKSVFLTKAQEQIVFELYSGNSVIDGFEHTESIRRYLNSLVKTFKTVDKETNEDTITNKSFCYKIPDEVWFIIYEQVLLKDESLGCANGNTALVQPVSHDDLFKVLDNPFKGPNKYKVLRLDIQNNIVELISDYNIESYSIRYLSRPSPIILEDLTPLDVQIDGVSQETECKLNKALHRPILEKAVQLAKAAYIGQIQQQ